MKLKYLTLSLVILVFIISACANTGTPTGKVIKEYDVSVHDKEGFDPKELTISSGDQVSWKNEGHRDMILLMFKDGEQYLQQNAITSGDTFVHQFNETGSYDIYWNIIKGPVTSKLIVHKKI